MTPHRHHLEIDLIHAGEERVEGAVVLPVFQSAVFVAGWAVFSKPPPIGADEENRSGQNRPVRPEP